MARKIMKVANELFLDMFRGKHGAYTIIKNEIPIDARIVNIQSDNRDIFVVLESSEFCEDHYLIPVFQVEI